MSKNDIEQQFTTNNNTIDEVSIMSWQPQTSVLLRKLYNLNAEKL